MGHGIHLLLSSNSTRTSCIPTSVTTAHASSEIRDELISEQIHPQEAASPSDHSREMNFKHFCGLHLPLDYLEIPSMFMEKMVMNPKTLKVILSGSVDVDECTSGRPDPSDRVHQDTQDTIAPQATGHLVPAGHEAQSVNMTANNALHSVVSDEKLSLLIEGELGGASRQASRHDRNAIQVADEHQVASTALSQVVIDQLAVYYKATHYNALDFQEQVRLVKVSWVHHSLCSVSCSLPSARIH
jgi:hypothetical protein